MSMISRSSVRPSKEISSRRPRNGLTKYAPALATIRACGAENISVMLTRMCSFERMLSARTPSGIMGILTITLGCHVAISRASRRMPGVSVDTTSALTTPSFKILAISTMCSRKGRFSLATSVGLVVTPSIPPSDIPCRISSRFAVSRKNFMFVASLIRTATNTVGRTPPGSGRGIHSRISQRPDSGNHDFHHVAGLHGAHPRRRARRNHVARQQRHYPRNPGNYNINGEEHCAEGGVLFPHPIQEGFNCAVGDVELRFENRSERAERVKGLGARPLFVEGLVVARADVVEQSVAGNVGAVILAVAQIVALAPHDHGKLAFEIDALHPGQKHDRITGRK